MTPPQYDTYHIYNLNIMHLHTSANTTPLPPDHLYPVTAILRHFHLQTSTFTHSPPHAPTPPHRSTPPPLRLHLDNFASTPSTHSSTFAFQSPQQSCTYTFLPLYFQLYLLTSTSTSFYLPSLTPHFHLHLLSSTCTSLLPSPPPHFQLHILTSTSMELLTSTSTSALPPPHPHFHLYNVLKQSRRDTARPILWRLPHEVETLSQAAYCIQLYDCTIIFRLYNKTIVLFTCCCTIIAVSLYTYAPLFNCRNKNFAMYE